MNKNIRYLALCVLLSLLLCACGKVKVTADISAYENTPITVSGLEEEEFEITAGELSQLDCVGRTSQGRTAKAGTVNAVGPLLTTFLEHYGKQVTDFSRIRFIAKDGYKITLKDAYLTDYDVVLAVSEADDPLSDTQNPLRLVIPGAESGMWAYGIIRIEFVPVEQDAA